MEILSAIMFFAPFALGCVAYVCKFAWFAVLRRPKSPFYDPVPMRWWFLLAAGVALAGLPIVTYPYPVEDNAYQSIVLFFTLFAWGWPFFYGRELFSGFPSHWYPQ